nr:hypothetical protein [Tanacetum cinerariifolium]
MRDEHLDTILATELDEFIKSSIENLVPNPSESEDLSDSECDVPACDDFTTFSNFLFDADYEFSSSDDDSKFNSKNSDAIIKSFSPSPIPVEDSDPLMKEIDLFLASDGSIPLGIDNDYSDSEGDNLCFTTIIFSFQTLLTSLMSSEFFFPLHLSGDFFNSSLPWE